MTGIETARATSAITVQSASPLNPCARERGWTATAATPHSSSSPAISTAFSESSSHPLRILAVTGRPAASTTAKAISRRSAGSRMRADPPPPRTTFFAGQPTLMSMASGESAAAAAAAPAIASGRAPNIWNAIGRSSSANARSSNDFAPSRTSPSALTISVQTMDAPLRLHILRMALSVSPARGASTNGVSQWMLPICMNGVYCPRRSSVKERRATRSERPRGGS